MKHRKNTLEARALDLLQPYASSPSATFTIRAHALTHDGEGWSSNDRWTIARDVDLAEALDAIRGRWEVFRANYAPKAQVQNVQTDCPHHFDGTVIFHLDAENLAFLDIEISGPLVTLADHVCHLDGPPTRSTLDDIARDLAKARRDFDFEEYTQDSHRARLEALESLYSEL